MRPQSQLKVIHSKLDILKDIKLEVQRLQDYMDNILLNGKCWIEETDGQRTFFELDQYLMVETSICVEKCIHIANENKELRQTMKEKETVKSSLEIVPDFRDSKDFKKMIEKFEDNEKRILQLEETLKTNEEKNSKFGKNLNKHTNKIKDLEREIQKQKVENETNTKQNPAMDINSELKFEEVMTELQAASNFMSHLNSQTETLTQTVNENKEKMKSMTDQINKNEKLIQSVCPLVDVIQDIQNKLKEQEVHVNKLKQNFQNAFEQNREQFDSLDRKSETVGSNLTELKSQSDSLQIKVKETETNFSKLSQNTDSLYTKIPEILTTLYNLETSMDIDRKANDEKNEELKSNIREIDNKFTNISSQVQNLLQQTTKLDSKKMCVAVNVGSLLNDITLNDNEIIKCMTNVSYITGDIFDSNTGIFTAPVEGLYLYSVSMSGYSNDEFIFDIQTKDSKGEEQTISLLFYGKDSCLNSLVKPVFMKKNDELYLKSQSCTISDFYIQFACILIQ